HAL
ncbi:hypothetical protein D049_3828B, partial [Vibrio parahaemolyticus VPTS-2010]